MNDIKTSNSKYVIPNTKPKIIVIVGTNASGKSGLGIRLAKKFEGEIVCADSRQVYRGLNIGSGKVTRREMAGISHHLLDVASPNRRFDVTRYQKLALKAITSIHKCGKLPIVVGGTGYFIDSVIYNQSFPNVKPDTKLRKKLKKYTTIRLFARISRLDLARARELKRTGQQSNRRRLIRAIEIVTKLGIVPPVKLQSSYDVLWLGIRWDDKKLHKRIHDRIITRMKIGMVAEVRRLHLQGLSYKRMGELGLEYKFLAYFLQGKINKQQMLEKLETAIWQYARRQKTWFKRNGSIAWLNGVNYKVAQKLCKKHLSK